MIMYQIVGKRLENVQKNEKLSHRDIINNPVTKEKAILSEKDLYKIPI